MAVTFEPRTVAFGDMIIVRGAYEAGDTTIDLSGFFRPSGVEMFDMTPNAAHATISASFTDATVDTTDDPTIAHDSNLNIERGMVVIGTGVPLSSTVSVITSATAFELSAATTGGSLTNTTFTFAHGIIGIVNVNDAGVYFNFPDAIIEDTFTLADATNVITLLSGVKTTAGAKTAGTFMAMGRRG